MQHRLLCLNVETLALLTTSLKRRCQLFSTNYKFADTAMKQLRSAYAVGDSHPGRFKLPLDLLPGYEAKKAKRITAQRHMQVLKPLMRLVRAMSDQQRSDSKVKKAFIEVPKLVLRQAGVLSSRYSVFWGEQPLEKYSGLKAEGQLLLEVLTEMHPEIFPVLKLQGGRTSQGDRKLKDEISVYLILSKIVQSKILNDSELQVLQDALN